MAPSSQPLHNRLDLAAVPSDVGRARRHALDVLQSWQIPCVVVHDVLLIVSELVSNAVRHAVPPSEPATPEGRETVPVCSLNLWLMSGHLFVAVHDPDRRPPVLRHAPPGAECGRGLQLVDRLSAAWGYSYPTPGAGKLVWVKMPVPDIPLQSGEPAQGSRAASPSAVRSPGHLARLAGDP